MTEKDMEIQANARTISQLRRENIQLRAMLDAAIADLKSSLDCDVCKYNTDEFLNNGYCRKCSVGKTTRKGWEWRGIQDD